jgi:hypothetical protein
MPVELPFQSMTHEDGLHPMEALLPTSPDWHAAVLAETEQAVKEGRAFFSDWDEAKVRIRERLAKLG